MQHVAPFTKTAEFLEANGLDSHLNVSQVADLVDLSRHQLRRRCKAQRREWDEATAPKPKTRHPYVWSLAEVLRWLAGQRFRQRVEFEK